MTYDEWLATLLPFEAKALTRREIFQAGAVSRDAEIASLKTVPMRYRRMAFNAQLQDEIAELEQESDQLREHVTMLRDALKFLSYMAQTTGNVMGKDAGLMDGIKAAEQALAATEPKA